MWLSVWPRRAPVTLSHDAAGQWRLHIEMGLYCDLFLKNPARFQAGEPLNNQINQRFFLSRS